MTVRTRVAPSPTGDPHVGTAYIALFNRAFARSQGGQFILRIEDTDQSRGSKESEQNIFDSLRWLGLDWDEGPDIGGPFGSYRQSERKSIYAEHAQKLLDSGSAFTCFCTRERLDEVRKTQRAAGETTRYDGHCLSLDGKEVGQRTAQGETHVVRMKVPEEGVCKFDDVLRGQIEIPWSQIDMQVLVKADGMPTYHLAVVVDDHLMEISHVLRGEEWISSFPKHQLLYRYFGWEMPVHCHLPLLRNPDKSKLSKRKNPTSINYFRDAGYLPEALVNYLGLMGWSMPDEKEIFSPDEMIVAFNLERISLGAPVFDMEKLRWLSGQYMRAMSVDGFMDTIMNWQINREHLARIVPLIQERTETLSEIMPQVDYLLGDRKTLLTVDFEHKKLEPDQMVQILQFLLWDFEKKAIFVSEDLLDTCNTWATRLELKIRDLLFPLFIAISGRTVSLPLFNSMVILGGDLVRMRIRDAINVLGGVSKKKLKRLEKDYAALVRKEA